MNNRIDALFRTLASERRKGFVAYITAGDPDPALTAPIVIGLERSGADIVELGVPFSDPLAAGVVNQRAAERALQRGVDMGTVLEIVARVRKKSEIPLILFTYLNPIFSYGFEKFASDAACAGVDGVLALDLPPEESAGYERILRARGLHCIFIIAPTTPPQRAKLIARHARGFIYYVSRTGVTGERRALESDVARHVRMIKRVTTLPVAVGFGISTPAQVDAVAKVADAVVVGSALVREIEQHCADRGLVERICRKARWLSAPLRRERR